MKLFHALILGVFIIIALNVALGPVGNHGQSVATMFNAGGPAAVNITKALEGR